MLKVNNTKVNFLKKYRTSDQETYYNKEYHISKKSSALKSEKYLGLDLGSATYLWENWASVSFL